MLSTQGLRRTSAILPPNLLRKAENHEQLPLEALASVVELRRRLDEIERQAIASARAKGATWEDIGEALGITRQAIHQRLRHRPAAARK